MLIGVLLWSCYYWRHLVLVAALLPADTHGCESAPFGSAEPPTITNVFQDGSKGNRLTVRPPYWSNVGLVCPCAAKTARNTDVAEVFFEYWCPFYCPLAVETVGALGETAFGTVTQ
jgi:hypothetical protein